MIMKGSQRGGSGQLAKHLMNADDNDHVTVEELRGFLADDLKGAFAEIAAIAQGTRCTKFMFSLSLNPPTGAQVTREALLDAANRVEEALGLSGQPRATVIHEKNGRPAHAHVVWSRIDAQEMKAIEQPFFKNKLNALSKEIYLEQGWELPNGFRENGWKSPLNYTLAEWQQCKRLDLDPRELKALFREAWAQSDDLKSFKAALEEHGYFLAKGDRRGVVATDAKGEVFSVSRYAGVKTKELEQRIGGSDKLPALADVQADVKSLLTGNIKSALAKDLADQRAEQKPLVEELKKMVAAQRAEREKLRAGQEKRWHEESKQRSSKLRKGLGVVLDVLTGRLFKIRRENERDAVLCLMRDQAQREQLFSAQHKDRAGLQARMDAMKERHRKDRAKTARNIAVALELESDRRQERKTKDSSRNWQRPLELGPVHRRKRQRDGQSPEVVG